MIVNQTYLFCILLLNSRRARNCPWMKTVITKFHFIILYFKLLMEHYTLLILFMQKDSRLAKKVDSGSACSKASASALTTDACTSFYSGPSASEGFEKGHGHSIARTVYNHLHHPDSFTIDSGPPPGMFIVQILCLKCCFHNCMIRIDCH